MDNIYSNMNGANRKKDERDFLLAFFSDDSECERKLINGYLLVKEFNKKINNWYVVVSTPLLVHTQKDIKNFLLTFFVPPDKYEQKEINGLWLIKQFNKNKGNWNVAIYTQSALNRRKDYNKRKHLLNKNARGNKGERA